MAINYHVKAEALARKALRQQNAREIKAGRAPLILGEAKRK